MMSNDGSLHFFPGTASSNGASLTLVHPEGFEFPSVPEFQKTGSLLVRIPTYWDLGDFLSATTKGNASYFVCKVWDGWSNSWLGPFEVKVQSQSKTPVIAAQFTFDKHEIDVFPWQNYVAGVPSVVSKPVEKAPQEKKPEWAPQFVGAFGAARVYVSTDVMRVREAKDFAPKNPYDGFLVFDCGEAVSKGLPWQQWFKSQRDTWVRHWQSGKLHPPVRATVQVIMKGSKVAQVEFNDGMTPVSMWITASDQLGMQGKKKGPPGEPKSLVPGLTKHHYSDQCIGEFCPMHNPSDHPLCDAPLKWHNSRKQIMRVCDHGVWHVDPDEILYLSDVGQDGNDECMACDGCCTGNYVPPEKPKQKKTKNSSAVGHTVPGLKVTYAENGMLQFDDVALKAYQAEALKQAQYQVSQAYTSSTVKYDAISESLLQQAYGQPSKMWNKDLPF